MIANEENSRLVVVVNKRIEAGPAMNAVLHLGAAIVNLIGDKGRTLLKFLDFEDGDGHFYRSISARSFIVLRGTSSEIRKVCDGAEQAGILTAAFTSTMTGDTYMEQLERTKRTSAAELEFYGVAMFGEKDAIDPLTRKLSLWR